MKSALKINYRSFHVKLSHFQYRVLYFTQVWGYVLLCNSNDIILMGFFQPISRKNSDLQFFHKLGLEKKNWNHEITAAHY